MRIFRTMALALALCLTASVAAKAEAGGALRALDNWATYDYREAYPDREITTIRTTRDELGRSDTMALLSDPDSWDVASVDTSEIDLRALDALVPLADMRALPGFEGATDGMYPAIRGAVTAADGRVLGLPRMLFGCAMQTGFLGDAEALERLGFTEADAPRTFDELCELAQRYMALDKAARKGTAFHIDVVSSNGREYFLSNLLELYTSQYCDEDGAVDYDTEVFRHALHSLDAMCEALASDKKVRYGAGGSLVGLVNDASNSLVVSGASHLWIGDATVVPARMTVLIVNARAADRPEVADWLRVAQAGMMAQFAPLIYEHFDLGADDGSGDFYTREEIEGYRRSVAGFLTFPRPPRFDRWTIAKRYMRGELDADGLIEALCAVVPDARR